MVLFQDFPRMRLVISGLSGLSGLEICTFSTFFTRVREILDLSFFSTGGTVFSGSFFVLPFQICVGPSMIVCIYGTVISRYRHTRYGHTFSVSQVCACNEKLL